MNAIEIAFIAVALSGTILPWLVVLWAFRGMGRTNGQLCLFLDKSQRDHATIVSEMLAHKTLTETGNQFLAGQMLQHSNAHDFRAAPPIEPIRPPEPEPTQGPHDSPELMFGEDLDEMTPPGRGEER